MVQLIIKPMQQKQQTESKMGEQEDHNELKKRLAEADGDQVYAIQNGDGEIANLSIKKEYSG